MVWRSFWRAPALILTITALAMFFFYKMRIWPEHFWLARRFLTEILPGALIFASAAMFRAGVDGEARHLIRGDRRERHSRRSELIATVLLGFRYVSASLPIREHVEYAEMIPQARAARGRFSDNDLVLVEARAASDLHVLALPLSYIYARNVLVLYDSRPDKPSVREFLTWAHERYENVYFIAGGGTICCRRRRLDRSCDRAISGAGVREDHLRHLPAGARQKPFDFTIYRLVADGSDAAAAFAGHRRHRRSASRGLLSQGTAWRRQSDVSMEPGHVVPAHECSAREPRSGAQAERRTSARRAAAASDGVPRGRQSSAASSSTNEFRDYVFPIPAATVSNLAQRQDGVQIRIQSSTWIPRTILGGSDTRALGVMIDKAEIR